MGPLCPVLVLILLQRTLCSVITATSHDILVRPVGSFMGLYLAVEVIGLVLAEAGLASLEDVALIHEPISPPQLACPLMGYLACLLLSLRMFCVTCWTAGLLPLLRMHPLLHFAFLSYKSVPWIIDSGASDHMSGSSDLFSDYKPSSGHDKLRITDGTISSADKVAHHSIQSPTTKDDLWLWHRRLGHPFFYLLQHLFPYVFTKNNVSDF
ncbi:hypothetical protein CsSME_00002576 [Camellia sinensis var. sinensis]